MPRRSSRKFGRALRPYAEAYVLAYGAHQFFKGAYAPGEREFHVRCMKELKLDIRNPTRVRKYFHSLDQRMQKEAGLSLSSYNKSKRVDTHIAKFTDEPEKTARQIGKSAALGARYGSNPMLQSATWYTGDILRAEEEYRAKVLSR